MASAPTMIVSKTIWGRSTVIRGATSALSASTSLLKAFSCIWTSDISEILVHHVILNFQESCNKNVHKTEQKNKRN